MASVFKFMPSRIAALLYVQKIDSDPKPNLWAFMWHSQAKGIVTCDNAEKPLAETSLPEVVKEHIRKHLNYVFSLRHEDWNEPGPSPRSQYVDAAKPWELQVEEV